MNQNTLKNYTVEATPVASAKQIKDQKTPKAKRIAVGADVHLRGYQATRANRRKIACLAGMVPSEWSTGDDQRRGSITKVGVPAIRRIITEMVWRIVQFQPQYPPVQKWQEVLRGTNGTLKKKAVVAIGRQLMVDLWRMETGRVTAEELNLVMIGA